MKKFLSLLVILSAAALILAGCSPKSAALPPVSAQAEMLIAEGSLLPANTLDQSFSQPGQIAEVLVKDGDTVAAGQPLARLNSSPEASLALARARQEALAARQALDGLKTQADLSLAQARQAAVAAQTALDDAQKRYDKDSSAENQAALNTASARLSLARAAETKLASAAGVDPDLLAAAEARLAAAEAAQASAQAALDGLTLKSTLSGSVIDLAAQPGQRVGAGAPVITLADVSTWLVKTGNLTEMDVTSVSLGQKVEIVLDALPAVTLSGEVTHINARFEEKRGDITYTVTIQLGQTDPRLRWGMTAAVKFIR